VLLFFPLVFLLYTCSAPPRRVSIACTIVSQKSMGFLSSRFFFLPLRVLLFPQVEYILSGTRLVGPFGVLRLSLQGFLGFEMVSEFFSFSFFCASALFALCPVL